MAVALPHCGLGVDAAALGARQSALRALTACPLRPRAQPLPLGPYVGVLLLRFLTLNAAMFAVPWWPEHARTVWPTCVQAVVQVACMLHAPRQLRLVRQRWLHTAARARAHED